jgi:hypothetical protein
LDRRLAGAQKGQDIVARGKNSFPCRELIAVDHQIAINFSDRFSAVRLFMAVKKKIKVKLSL